MEEKYKLKQVFSRGMPTLTYVHRDHLKLEKGLQNAVARGNTIIAVTGPSKCGKTVLRRKVIPDNAVLKIEGGQVTLETDFWEVIREHLNDPISYVKQNTEQATTTIGANVSIGSHGVGLGYNENKANQKTIQVSQNFSALQKSRLLSLLIESGDVLVIDDFHYINTNIRAALVRALKSAAFDGLTVVILSVPYRAFDVLTAEAEMEGRFSHLSIPTWNKQDLKRIAEQGFPAMGMDIEQTIIDNIVNEALGSPLLMQSICAQVCIYLDILDTEQPMRHVSHKEIDFSEVFQSVANDFGLPAYEQLAAGPQTRRGRIDRKFKNGEVGDIYKAVLAAVAYLGAKEQISYDEIRAALKEVLDDSTVQKTEITRYITTMCEIARDMQVKSSKTREGLNVEGSNDVSDVAALDWKDDKLYINDVFLRFFLRWIRSRSLHEVSENF